MTRLLLVLDEWLHRRGIDWDYLCDKLDNRLVYGTWGVPKAKDE